MLGRTGPYDLYGGSDPFTLQRVGDQVGASSGGPACRRLMRGKAEVSASVRGGARFGGAAEFGESVAWMMQDPPAVGSVAWMMLYDLPAVRSILFLLCCDSPAVESAA